MLPAPPNGTVMWDDLIEGFIATYYCNKGFKLSGDETRTCTDRVWTGQEPICLRKYVASIHEQIRPCTV